MRDELRCFVNETPGQSRTGAAPLAGTDPCPICGWRLWLVSVLESRCAACGYRSVPQLQCQAPEAQQAQLRPFSTSWQGPLEFQGTS
jgi:hypothetical protein